MSFVQKPASSTLEESARLSLRECEIIEFLARGLVCKEIADRLSMSYASIWTYIERICTKLHVHSRSHAVAKYLGGQALPEACR